MFNKKIKKNKENEIINGSISDIDRNSPNYICLKDPKYFETNEIFYSGFIIYNYNRENKELILNKLINSNLNINISIFYEKKDSNKIIKDLTYYIGNNNVEISEKNNSNQEIDLISFSNNDAIYIRKQLQLENEELYYLYVYIIAFDKNKEELNKTMNCVENILVSSGMQCKKAYFREEQVFLSCLPIMYNHIDIKNVAKRNVLTSRFNFNFSFYVLICL